jgi:hypothetical protein
MTQGRGVFKIVIPSGSEESQKPSLWIAIQQQDLVEGITIAILHSVQDDTGVGLNLYSLICMIMAGGLNENILYLYSF